MPHDPVSRFWENFIEKTKAYSLKPATVRWHVRHAEAYIKAHSGRRLAEHTAEDIAAYLQEKGRNGRLADWQFAQLIRALQILFVDMVRAPWMSRIAPLVCRNVAPLPLEICPADHVAVP